MTNQQLSPRERTQRWLQELQTDVCAAVSRWLPNAAVRVQGFVVDKAALGQFSQSTSVSPANLHSTNFYTTTITYHLGLA
jgi:hypothetical protein